MDTIEVVIRKARRNAQDKPPIFTWTEPTMLSEVAPNPMMRACEYILVPHVETQIQNVPQLSNASTNTDVVAQSNRGMKHLEGGWPNNVDVEEREGRSKHCKKVEREERYLAACSALAGTMKPFLRLNCALDIFEVYDKFASEKTDADGEQAIAMEGGTGATPPLDVVQALDEPPPPPLSVTMKFAAPKQNLRVSQICFTCGSDSEMMVVGYVEELADAEREVPPSSDEPGLAAAVWSLTSCVAPVYTMYSAVGGCTSVAACPKDPYHVIGGSSNGIVQVWELREKGGSDEASLHQVKHFLPTSSSSRLSSHRDGVTDLKYIMSKGVDVMSTSIDGRVLFWELRNMSEPLYDETLELLVQPHRPHLQRGFTSNPSTPAAASLGVSPVDDRASEDEEDPFDSATLTPCCMDYDPMVGGVQQYLVGTAEGFVLSCTRRAQRNAERILHRYQVSLSSVFCAQRCSVIPKIFLTVGDWGWRLFGDEISTPIMSSAPRLRQVTCGRWHPTRPSIILTGTSGGYLEIWDLLDGGVCGPKVDVKVSDAPLRHCVPHASGKCVAVSDADGHVYLLQLSVEYHSATPKERASVVAVLEREFSRERQMHSQRHTEPQHALPLQQDDMITFGISDSVDADIEATLCKLGEAYVCMAADDAPEDANVRSLLQTAAPPAFGVPDELPDSTSRPGAKMSPMAREAARRRSSIDRAPTLDATKVFENSQVGAEPAPRHVAAKDISAKQRLGRF